MVYSQAAIVFPLLLLVVFVDAQNAVPGTSDNCTGPGNLTVDCTTTSSSAPLPSAVAGLVIPLPWLMDLSEDCKEKLRSEDCGDQWVSTTVSDRQKCTMIRNDIQYRCLMQRTVNNGGCPGSDRNIMESVWCNPIRSNSGSSTSTSSTPANSTQPPYSGAMRGVFANVFLLVAALCFMQA